MERNKTSPTIPERSGTDSAAGAPDAERATVFVSYARVEAAFARRLIDALETQDRGVWIDWRDIPPTAEWWREICRGIEQSDVFVVLVSPDTIASAACNLEFEYANALNKRVVPLLCRATDDASVESRLASEVPNEYLRTLMIDRDGKDLARDVWNEISAINWVDFTDGSDFEGQLAALLRALDTDVGHLHQHTRLLVRALEWSRDRTRSDLLLRGDDLDRAEAWLGTSTGKTPAPTALHPTFIMASRKAETTRQRRLVGAVSGALAAMTILAGIAFWQYRDAVHQAGVSKSIALAAQSQLELESLVPERAVLLALEALDARPYTWQAERALGMAVYGSRARRMMAPVQGEINDVAWSSDGRWAAATTSERSVAVHDLARGSRVHMLEHPKAAWGVDWSPRAPLLVVGSGNEAHVWNAETSETVAVLTGPERCIVRYVAWSPDGARIATLCDREVGDIVQVWNAQSAEPVAEQRPFFGATSMAWSPDSRRILFGGWRDEAWVWEVGTDEIALHLQQVDDWVTAVAWSPDGTRLATAGWDGRVTIWDARSGARVGQRGGHVGDILDIAWSPDGDHIATAGEDALIRVWAAGKDELLFELRGHENWVTAIDWSPDGSQLVSAGADGAMRVWDMQRDPALMTRPAETPVSSRLSVAWSKDGTRLLTSGSDVFLRVLDADTGGELRRFRAPEPGINDAMWSPDETRIVGASRICMAWMWDVESVDPVRSWRSCAGQMTVAAWSPDQTRLLTAGGWGDVRLWLADGRKEVLRLAGKTGVDVLSAAFSPDGARIAIGYDDNSIRIADTATGEVTALAGHTDAVTAIAWSPDGSHLASGGQDTEIIVWKPASGESLLRFSGHESGVNALAWSPNGIRLASGSGNLYKTSRDNSIRIWDLGTGMSLLTLSGQAGPVADLAWSPDGTRLASAGHDGSASVWRVWQTPAELVEHAERCCVVRDLTPAEREQFGLPR